MIDGPHAPTSPRKRIRGTAARFAGLAVWKAELQAADALLAASCCHTGASSGSPPRRFRVTLDRQPLNGAYNCWRGPPPLVSVLLLLASRDDQHGTSSSVSNCVADAPGSVDPWGRAGGWHGCGAPGERAIF